VPRPAGPSENYRSRVDAHRRGLISEALELAGGNRSRAARNLGASEWRVFWRVTMPLSRRAVIAASVLAFARALGDFGATLMLAGDIPGKTQTASIAIYDAVESGDTLLARVLVLVLSVTAIAIVYGANRLQQRQVTG